MIAAIDNKEFKENQLSFWNQLGDLAGGFANALMHGVGSAFDYLKQQAKQLLAEMIALFAKRWVLQLGGSLFGNAADPAAILASGGTEGLATSGLLGSGGMMNAMGAFMATPAGWVVAGIAAIAAIAYAFRDKGENWQATLGFGANAHAYTTQGVFGPEGFQSIQGNDALNRQIQTFMASTGTIDTLIAGTLSAATIATITRNLGGAYTTRNDGQPSQFAFGAGDETAGQQLTLEYLQKKYGTIFDQIDQTFADWIRSYTGDSGQLLQAIGDFAAVMNALQDSPIPGLDLESLRALQREGEKLSDTFNRVTGAWSTYVSLFYSQEEQHAMSMGMLQHQFEALGLVMPTTREGFRSLVESLEQGSPLWLAVIGMSQAFSDLVPAINSVADAAMTAEENFFSSLSHNGFSDTPWGGTAFGGGSSSSSPSGGGGEPYGGAYGPGGALYGGGGGYGPGPGGGEPAAGSDLASWLAGALGSSLSTASPLERLEALRQAYMQDSTAASSNAYLSFAQQLYGSGSQYNDIFQSVYNRNAGLVGAPDYNARMVELQSSINGHSEQTSTNTSAIPAIGVTLVQVLGILQTIASGQDLSTQEITAATDRSADRVERALTSEPAPR
jgi:hypothetical protein